MYPAESSSWVNEQQVNKRQWDPINSEGVSTSIGAPLGHQALESRSTSFCILDREVKLLIWDLRFRAARICRLIKLF